MSKLDKQFESTPQPKERLTIMFLQKLLAGKNDIPLSSNAGDQAITKPKSTRIPHTDITEAGDYFSISLSMPGVARERVEITVKHNILTIRGSLSAPQQTDLKLMHQECSEFDFQHSFTLPEEIDRDGITAKSQYGVLLVKIPKAQIAQRRQIPVSVG